MNGLFNEMTYFNGVHETVADILKSFDDLGGPKSYPHYAAGWAVAGDTPFAWTKQVAANYGGTRNGMVVHYPSRIKARGEVRSQWHHVIDVAPTILEVAGLPEPKSVGGVPQAPIEGVSLAYTFDAPDSPSRRTTQYFEIFGNRAVYHEGWLAGTVHRAPWEAKPRSALDADEWELYDTRSDFSLANDLASKAPEKLRELQALFLKEAAAHHALPLDDRFLERVNAAKVGRPDLMAGRKSLSVYEGMVGLMENVFIDVKNRAHTITAEVEIPADGGDGVILCQGGRFGGWSLYLKGGKPTYTYNWLGLARYSIAAPDVIPAGPATIRFTFTPEDGRPGPGGAASIEVDGKKVVQAGIERTQGFFFSADEGADVGMDAGTPVTEEYSGSDNRFLGKIKKVTVEVK
jgi:arylsulfatase